MVCGVTETRDHILFLCPIAKFTWSCFREALGWVKSPRGFQDCLDVWIPLGCVDYKLKLFVLGVALWVLWNTRNKLVIEGVCPISPSDVVYKMISYMQRWRALLRGEEQAKMEVKLQQVGGG
jgi:hypothetical protein